MTAPAPAPAAPAPVRRRPARPRARPAAVTALLAAVLAGVVVAALGIGDFALSPGQVVATLFGGGPPGAGFIVMDLRLPRVLAGCAVGAALALGGAIFQSITRNPLGSPDIVGFTVGSASGGIVAILLFGGGALQIACGAVGGGLLTALAVYLLAFRDGVHGLRLVLVGIGISAMLEALNAFLLSRAEVNAAQSASAWLVGSLNARGWESLRPLLAVLALLLPCAALLARDLRMLELGDPTAGALGVRVERSRLAIMAVGVALTAAATATAGPVAFIALAAPQLAKRLTRAPGPNLPAAALMGAVLLSASDIAAQRLIAPTQLPVGVMTGFVGGVYLGWLMLTEWRAGRA
ncbi:FecCD family ABC transporter permease [Actinomadura parmotrematis]|uniref:Iron chelate uptake ABC transporter family permease subunit n=1 Tax=Actinomadura parmotrematis TaxID=2864039 RepID=A0ABS7FKR8_9ACTN|nr:iron chelate uptake ABC transporter family permease subunit [Actinomadura parmotrematis]MBW8480967.1 iron chelate uptake ABC transporter family permease subunit [Actinomadura parmotrematis]